MRYLINEKKVSVYEVHDLKVALGAVEALAMEDANDDENVFLARNKSKWKLEKGRIISYLCVNEVQPILLNPDSASIVNHFVLRILSQSV